MSEEQNEIGRFAFGIKILRDNNNEVLYKSNSINEGRTNRNCHYANKNISKKS